MGKNVQIPEELFFQLCKLFLVNPDSEELYNDCKSGIQAKFDKLMDRDLYGKFHDANLPDAEREQARQAYLDRKGISQDFRWPSP